MRDKHFNSQYFVRSVQSICEQIYQRFEHNRGKTAVIDNSNFQLERRFFFSIDRCNLQEFMILGLISWYLPEEIAIMLRLDLECRMKEFSLKDRILCEQVLESKAETLLFLIETKLYHSRDFFGNILTKNFQLSKFLKIKPLKRGRINRPQRKRGYNDKGSTVELHKRLGLGSQIRYTKEFKELEYERFSFDSSKHLIFGIKT